MARHSEVITMHSKVLVELARILKETGYITGYRIEETVAAKRTSQKSIVIDLSYKKEKGAIEKVVRVSRPGQRVYTRRGKIPYVLTGYGIAIISTSKGIMTDGQAREAKLGGEIICKIW